MANKKRKVYFSALQVRGMLSNEAEEDRTKIKTEIFDPIVAKYDAAKEQGDFSAFQRKIEDGAEVFMVSMLHYEGNVLCGIVSHGTPKIERYFPEKELREIADALGCDLEINLVMRDSGEKV